MKKYMVWILLVSLMMITGGCSDSDGYSTSKAGNGSINRVIEAEKSPKNWYIRVVAQDVDRGLLNESSQLGEIDEVNAVQDHTLPALGSFAGSYIDVVFVDPEGMPAGEYKTSFYTYQNSTTARWPFSVKTDDVNADIHLTWRGLYILNPYTDAEGRTRYKEFRSASNPIVKRMRLIDTATSKEIPLVINGVVQSYDFNMNGTSEHTFEWVLEVEDNTTTAVKAPTYYATDKSSVNTSSKLRDNRSPGLKRNFDLSNPPQLVPQR